MDEGQRINITFLHFDIYYQLSYFDIYYRSTYRSCLWGWLEIEGVKYCGEILTPFSIITSTNTVNLIFKSQSRYETSSGFVAIWPQYDLDTPTGCSHCDFPFMFGDITLDTCISVLGVDDQPWCPYNKPPIVNTHLKISCSDSDSSCPSTPSQTVITSPNYPWSYPNNVYEVKLIK